MEELTIHFKKRAYDRILDLYMRYDKCMLTKHSQNLTIFQTLFNVLRLVTLLMGWTNSVPIFYENVTYILKEEISEYILTYINDIPVKKPATIYEKKDETCEMLISNSGIRKFIFEHLNTVDETCWRNVLRL